MAPKKKQKTAHVAVAAVDALPEAICQEYLVKVHEAISCIQAHDMFSNIAGQPPLSPKEGGREALWDGNMAASALKTAQSYRCAANFFSQDFLWLATHKIPINLGQVKQIQNYWFPKDDEPPKLCPFVVTVAVDSHKCSGDPPQSGWPRLSPAEPVHALLFAAAEAIKSKQGANVLQAFKSCFLTCTFVYEVVPVGEARYFRSLNIREEQVEKGLAVQMSLRQRIYDIAGFAEAKKTTDGIVGSKKLAALYCAQVKLASNQEKMSESFVDSALTIYNRVLSQDACCKVLEQCDAQLLDKSPWKSIYALQALVDRANTPEMISWCLQGLVDGWRMGHLDPGVFVIAKLKDSRASYVEVLKLKRKVRDYLLGDWLNSLPINDEWKKKLSNSFTSFDACRNFFAPFPGDPVDTAWMLAAPVGVLRIAEFFDQIIYGNEFDGRYKDGIKMKHDVADLLEYPTVKSVLQELEAAVRSELKPEKSAEPVTVEETAPAAPATAPAAAASEAASASDAAPAESAPAKPFDRLSTEDQTLWRQQMRKVLQQHVRFVCDHKSSAELEEALKDTPFISLRGDQTGLCLYHFDLKKYGEPTTRPDVRVPTFREALYGRLVKSILAARSAAQGLQNSNLQAGEVALILDGGKRGLKNKLLHPWREGTASKNADDDAEEDGAEADMEEDDGKPTFFADLLQIAYSESSLAARKKRLRGNFNLKQIEWCHVLSTKKLSLPVKERLHYAGSTNGDLICNVHLPGWNEEWQLPWKMKKDLYGKKHLIAVGSKTEGADDQTPYADRRNNGKEPVCFHSPPEEFYAELIHDFYVKLILDLTPSDGKMAVSAIKSRVGYVGVCYNPEHQSLLEERLLEVLEMEMRNSGSSLFSAAYCEAVGCRTALALPGEEELKKKNPKPVPKKKAKAKPKAKSTRKRGSRAAEKDKEPADDDDKNNDDDENQGGEEEDEEEDVWDPFNDE